MKDFFRKDRHLFIALALIAVGLILTTAVYRPGLGILNSAASRLIVPLENGINLIGTYITEKADGFRDNAALAEEVRRLTEENESLEAERAENAQKLLELERLTALYELDQEYPDYEMIGARVISKEPGNWYQRFKINKGSEDGVAVDMNVMTGGGLCGIVYQVGPHWAAVRAIIDDESNVSAMVADTADLCTVTGSLIDMDDGVILFYGLRDAGGLTMIGDRIITSGISEKFLPGLTIGYISELTEDANNLTKSGKLIPAADFRSLREVLVITAVKESAEEEAAEEGQ
ncbi:MAG: rod shape-determining protein MreC [Lachnospiraceae bacterium]|nr:rod shape-determining protein MreC [Lachnospiraceae bacterium]